MPKLRVPINGLRQRAARRTANALWMTLYGAGASSVIWWEGSDRWVGGAIWTLVTLALGLAGIEQLGSIRKLSAASVAPRKFDRVLGRKIAAVIGIYAVAEGISALALHALHNDSLIFPIAAGIAGVHFWAFAWVLGVWQYVVTGILDCLFVALTLAVVSPESMIGSMSAWVFYPLLGGGAALLVTAGLMLYESRGILSRLSAVPAG
jgi:hypothetical protein